MNKHFIIQLNITLGEYFNYNNSILPELSLLPKTYDFIDLDNHSSEDLIQRTISGITSSDKTCICIFMEEGAKLGALIHLLTLMVENPKNKIIFLKGQNSFVLKMLAPISTSIYTFESIQEIESKLQTYF